jgi:hypothetical protein
MPTPQLNLPVFNLDPVRNAMTTATDAILKAGNLGD